LAGYVNGVLPTPDAALYGTMGDDPLLPRIAGAIGGPLSRVDREWPQASEDGVIVTVYHLRWPAQAWSIAGRQPPKRFSTVAGETARPGQRA